MDIVIDKDNSRRLHKKNVGCGAVGLFSINYFRKRIMRFYHLLKSSYLYWFKG